MKKQFIRDVFGGKSIIPMLQEWIQYQKQQREARAKDAKELADRLERARVRADEDYRMGLLFGSEVVPQLRKEYIDILNPGLRNDNPDKFLEYEASRINFFAFYMDQMKDDTPEELVPHVERLRALYGFDREDLPFSTVVDEASGIIISGTMGSGKSAIARRICQEYTLADYSVVYLDPHSNTTQEDLPGALIIDDELHIFQTMLWFELLMKQKDKSKILLVADEWMEIKGHTLNKDGEFKGYADKFIRISSTKPRKFNKSVVFITHSPNVAALGIDSYLRENYHIISLGGVVRGKVEDFVAPYPCRYNDNDYKHPTHWHHHEYAKNGQFPISLVPTQTVKLEPKFMPLYTEPDPERHKQYCQELGLLDDYMDRIENRSKLTGTQEDVDSENSYPSLADQNCDFCDFCDPNLEKGVNPGVTNGKSGVSADRSQSQSGSGHKGHNPISWGPVIIEYLIGCGETKGTPLSRRYPQIEVMEGLKFQGYQLTKKGKDPNWVSFTEAHKAVIRGWQEVPQNQVVHQNVVTIQNSSNLKVGDVINS